jgi:hypothetical protein
MKEVNMFDIDFLLGRINAFTLKQVNGVASIISIQRVHELYKTVRVEDPESYRDQVNELLSDSNISNSKSGRASSSCQIKVVELYKFPKPAREIFGHVQGEYGEYLKISEVKYLNTCYLVYAYVHDLILSDNSY